MFNYSAFRERRRRRSYHRLPTSRNIVLSLKNFNKSCKLNIDRLVHFALVTISTFLCNSIVNHVLILANQYVLSYICQTQKSRDCSMFN